MGELQRAIKNPIGNFGLVFGEVSKRAGHAVGMASANHLASHVHPNLVESAALTCKGVDAFGAAVEAVLIKHGKNIIHEQFLLNRLANATIDIYVTSCVLSRCSKSLTEGVESAHHEEMMTKVWCAEAYTRITNNLNELKNPERLSNYKSMAEISKNVCSKNGPVQGGPLGI